MDGARFSRAPHLSWFRFSISMQPATALMVEQRQVTHTLALGTAGAVDVRWTCRGRERRYHHGPDQTAFFGCDGDFNTRVLQAAQDSSSAFVLHVPRHHLDGLAEADGIRPLGECRTLMPFEDSVLRECLFRLQAPCGDGVDCDIGSELVARRLVSRLIEVLGGGKPEWQDDASGFTTQEMKRIVHHIDSRLLEGHRFCLEEISALVGLSPSHCARKVRQTVGVSLYRFIQRRRVMAAMIALRIEDVSLAKLALDLGFSSQSHLTRLFSNLTGMTPAKHRRLFKRTVG